MKLVICLLATVLLGVSVAAAQAPPKVETVVDGLTNPCGVAVQPETGTVFVADSGASRIVRIVDGKAEDVIVGFPKDVYGKGPMVDIGPLGLLFLSKDVLVVGGGGLPDGEELLRVYEVPEAGADAIQADKMVNSFKLPPTDEIKGEGNFYQLAKTSNAIYVTCNGDDTKGWVAKATLSGTKVGSFERFLATKEATDVDAPVGITISPDGDLVVGQMGEINIPNDSLLTFYDPEGKMLLNLETELHDIAALMYSEKTGQLYALDYFWPGQEKGGLFRLVAVDNDGQQGVKAKPIVELDKPTAMAFGPDGTLYITVIGTGEGEDAKPGKLVKIAPGL